MLQTYLPILVFIGIGIAIGCLPMIVSRILGPYKPNAEKKAPYECGFDRFEDARIPFDVRYYLVALLFIIFDLETAFFFPWGVALRDIGWFGFTSMMIFLLILLVGFVFEWKKGALEWE